ncbi:DUF968 domain-containing protein [Edwardsiella tarda]|uniref:DUF968 domain-containing protein n=1 Tax=Edwardsiella tarda TaxID=636 RepID=UPI000D50FE53
MSALPGQIRAVCLVAFGNEALRDSDKVWARESPHLQFIEVNMVEGIIMLVGDEAPLAGCMRRPKLLRWESSKYTRWVKTQPCCGCGNPADDPHHIINSGLGLGGIGTKTHDLFVIPLCRRCHDELHRDVGGWEQRNGSQLVLLVQFLNRALGIGAIIKA